MTPIDQAITALTKGHTWVKAHFSVHQPHYCIVVFAESLRDWFHPDSGVIPRGLCIRDPAIPDENCVALVLTTPDHPDNLLHEIQHAAHEFAERMIADPMGSDRAYWTREAETWYAEYMAVGTCMAYAIATGQRSYGWYMAEQRQLLEDAANGRVFEPCAELIAGIRETTNALF